MERTRALCIFGGEGTNVKWTFLNVIGYHQRIERVQGGDTLTQLFIMWPGHSMGKVRGKAHKKVPKLFEVAISYSCCFPPTSMHPFSMMPMSAIFICYFKNTQ